MKIFCFLGNPGEKYLKTRHNAGWIFADYLAHFWNFSEWKTEKKFFGSTSEGNYNGEKIIFLKPETFMNVSGKSLLALAQFYKIDESNIIIFFDDKDLPLGTYRYRKKGSAGGHNGVKDIIRVFGTDEFDRIKIGVDTEKRSVFGSTADFVLSNFSSQEIEELREKVFPEVEKYLTDVV